MLGFFVPRSMLITLYLAWAILFLATQAQHDPWAMRWYKEFWKAPEAPHIDRFPWDENCVRRYQGYIGLNSLANVCWDGKTFGALCPRRNTSKWYEMDDYYGAKMQLLTKSEWKGRYGNNETSKRWLKGVTYLMASHLWPHSSQYLWPVLNMPVLGLTLAGIGDLSGQMWGRRGSTIPYIRQAMEAIANIFHAEYLPSAASHRSMGPVGFHRNRLLCFDRIIVPNKGPSRRYRMLSRMYVNPRVLTDVKEPFLNQLYQMAKLKKSVQIPDMLPQWPTKPPWRVVFINRLPQSGRRITNEDEVAALVRTFDIPVDVVAFEGMNFFDQFLWTSQAGILLSPHGGQLASGHMIARKAIILEVFQLGMHYAAGEWMRWFQMCGTRIVEVCPNLGNPGSSARCPPHPGNRPYIKNSSAISIEFLRPFVARAVDMISRYHPERAPRSAAPSNTSTTPSSNVR